MPSSETPKLFALFVGINLYRTSPLEGSINDVLAIRNYFQKLCEAQQAETGFGIQPIFKYLLAPLDEAEQEMLRSQRLEPGDEDKLFEEAGQYYRPIRNNIIQAFEEHFSQANPKRGDFCLLYYSGHGSMMEAPAIFSEVEPTGVFQTLTLLESREPGKRDLIDKELGYLIARTMEGKEPDPEQAIPGVHFLAIMDCCHSGSNTRKDEPDAAVRRMRKGPAVKAAEDILGFTTEGNCFYEKLIDLDGQPKIPRGGIKHGRHISLAAARDAETAKEKGLYVEEEEAGGKKIKKKKRHGVFTYSLLRTLEESGTHISYGELIRRVQMEVRSRTENQIPVLGKTIKEEEDLLFLNNKFKTPAREYEVGYRNGTWYLNAGAIHGIVPGRDNKATIIKVKVKTRDKEQPALPERLVAVENVLTAESILDGTPFTEEDQERLLIAAIQEMPFPSIRVGFGEKLPDELKNAVKNAFERNNPQFAVLAKDGEFPEYLINSVINERGEPSYVLTRPGSDIPLFMNRDRVAIFLRDVNKVGKWEGVLKMDNSGAEEVKEHLGHIQVEAKTLEGYPFTARTFNTIPDTAYHNLPSNPRSIHLSYKKVMMDGEPEYQQPALRLKVNNLSEENEYWAGALYLNSQFGITHRYSDVRKLSADENNTFLELEFQDQNGKTYRGVPVSFDEDYHHLGISEITDYVVIFVSSRPFDLSQYYQTPLPLYRRIEREGFEAEKKAEKDFWFTIKIPIHIRYPIQEVQLTAGSAKRLGGITLSGPEGFTATVQPTTRANARRRIEAGREKTRSSINEKAFLPPGGLWTQAARSDAVFSRGLANAGPEDYVSILELTNIKGSLTETHPLVITPVDPEPKTEAIVPFAYDPEHDLYFPIGHTNETGQVIINRLPDKTAGIIGEEDPSEEESSLRGSVKLFFHKLVWS